MVAPFRVAAARAPMLATRARRVKRRRVRIGYYEAVDDRLATRLSPITALDEGGAIVALGPFWQDRPVVLAFVRHFG